MMPGADSYSLGMILKGYPRISETFISNEIRLLETYGFSVHIFSMRRPRENFSHDSVRRIRAKVDYLPETLLTAIPRLLYHNILLAAGNPAAYARALKLAIRRFFRTRRSATLKHLLQAGYLVHRLLPATAVAHFHAHFAHSPASVAMFAGLLSGLDFSFTAHAKDIYTSDPGHLADKMARARFVVTCTEYNRKYLHALSGSHKTAIHRIYHGIDMDLFAGPEREKKPSGIHQVLTVARLTRKKGLPTVLRAIKILREQGVALQYTLIGDGEESKQIIRLVKQLQLDRCTTWLGTQPHEVVLQHYRQADIFVLGCEVAEDGDRDGIPNVLMESMAMGVPVVATRVSAIPELITDGQSGLLVPPGHPEMMAAAILRLLSDTALRQGMIGAAERRVRENFDNKVLTQDLADLFEKKVRGLKKSIIEQG
ncbi:MAG: glycosyltransferase [Desulfobacterales bacterium]|nr:glycosyltransferase [Desulfobacterales bacterium]